MHELPFGLFSALKLEGNSVLVGVKLSLPAALKADLNIAGHYCVTAISASILVRLLTE